MTTQHGTHNDLHSDQGALTGEQPGRARNPVIKVLDLAWLEFAKPDLAATERFAHAFGFATVSRTGDELQLRGTDTGSPRHRPRRPAVEVPRCRVPRGRPLRRAAPGRRHRSKAEKLPRASAASPST